jgi:hypothetical protein
LERIRTVPPGGSWKDIPQHLMPERFRKVRMTDYMTLYGRILEDHPSYTISASFANVTSGCFTHPRHHRALTVREGCRLQGFPDSFEVIGPIPAQYRQIGNAVPALAATKLLRHLEALKEERKVDAVKMRLDEQLLFAKGEPRLPILTPRYQRTGYGSGTYWPKGWGKAPDARPSAATDYRISTEPIRFRRSDWRRVRDQNLLEALDRAEPHDWTVLLKELADHKSRIAAAIDATVPPKEAQSHSDLATRSFLRFLAPVTSFVAATAAQCGDVVVRVDFGLTGEWLLQLLTGFTARSGQHLRLIDAHGRHVGRSRSAIVAVTSGPWPASVDVKNVAAILLVSPFADQAKALGLSCARIVRPSRPVAAVRVRSLSAPWSRLLDALGAPDIPFGAESPMAVVGGSDASIS